MSLLFTLRFELPMTKCCDHAFSSSRPLNPDFHSRRRQRAYRRYPPHTSGKGERKEEKEKRRWRGLFVCALRCLLRQSLTIGSQLGVCGNFQTPPINPYLPRRLATRARF